MIEQLERDPSNPAGQPLPRTVVISQGVDAAAPVVIEVVVDRESPVSLELLTKLLIVGVVFLATRHIAPSVAIVGAILSAFIPDVVSSMVRRHRWGKKRVGILAALVTFFAALDSAFGKAMRRHRRKPQRPGIGGARQALGAGHAAMTTAAAVTACAIAVTVPALASGGSPFPASRAHASAPAVTPVRAAARTHPQNQQQAARDRFVRLGVSPTGAPGSMTLAPGRRVHFEFTLKQPSKVIFAIGTGSTLNAFDLWHDDNQEGSSSIDIDSTHPYTADLAAGPHTITVESTDRQAATLRYVLYASTDLTQAAGISPDGVPGGVTVTPGQRAHLAFTLAQSGHVVFAVSSGSTLAAYSIWHDDNQDGSSSIDIDSTHPYTADLGAGTHTITIEPSGTGAGTLRYVLYASTGINRGMDVSPRGIRGQVGVTPGQRAHLAFTLAQSSHVVFAVSPNSALTAYDIWHDDNQDGSSSIDIDSTHPYTADLAAGAHTITIAPDGAASGALVYTLFASADVTQTVDATPDGTSGSVSVTPGQRAHLEFTLKQPGHVVLAIDPNSTLTAYSIWHDDNQDGSSSIDIDSTRPDTADLAAGTHTITIAPDGATAGELLYKLTAGGSG